MKFPKSLTTVTPLSKILALFLFILLPFLGFFFGMGYQKKLSDANSLFGTSDISSSLKTTNISSKWETYSDTKYGFSFKYPDSYKPNLLVYPWGLSMGCACPFFKWFEIEAIITNQNPRSWWDTNGKGVFNGKVGINNKSHEDIVESLITTRIFANQEVTEIIANTRTNPLPANAKPFQTSGGMTIRIDLIKNKDGLFLITSYDTASEPGLFDQIFSTFKFIN